MQPLKVSESESQITIPCTADFRHPVLIMLRRLGGAVLFATFLLGLASAASAEPPAPPLLGPRIAPRCCDDTLSPSCACSGPRRGCCSHHKGVVAAARGIDAQPLGSSRRSDAGRSASRLSRARRRPSWRLRMLSSQRLRVATSSHPSTRARSSAVSAIPARAISRSSASRFAFALALEPALTQPAIDEPLREGREGRLRLAVGLPFDAQLLQSPSHRLVYLPAAPGHDGGGRGVTWISMKER